jgi:hypothetical protein
MSRPPDDDRPLTMDECYVIVSLAMRALRAQPALVAAAARSARLRTEWIAERDRQLLAQSSPAAPDTYSMPRSTAAGPRWFVALTDEWSRARREKRALDAIAYDGAANAMPATLDGLAEVKLGDLEPFLYRVARARGYSQSTRARIYYIVPRLQVGDFEGAQRALRCSPEEFGDGWDAAVKRARRVA